MVGIIPLVPHPPSHLHEEFKILVKHPGYDEQSNVLLTLLGSDFDYNGDLGLQAQFILDVCFIICGDSVNKEGWLSECRDGSDRIDPLLFLKKPTYYFHLDGFTERNPYPIVPSFRHWKFPHKNLPPHWKAMDLISNSITLPSLSNLSALLFLRDGSCRLSGWRDGLQVAHIVPKSEFQWFKDNQMSQYNRGGSDQIDDSRNALLLRVDLHLAFDQSVICLVPKGLENSNDFLLAAHIFKNCAEIWNNYQNRQLFPAAISVEFLYARFAWSVFKMITSFLTSNVKRRLTLLGTDVDLLDDLGYVNPTDCPSLFKKPSGNSRGNSKRRIESDTVIDGLESFADTDSNTQSSEPSLQSLSPQRPPYVQKWLDEERSRSDPNNTRKEEREWLRKVYNGKILSSQEALRWYEASGYEVREE